MTKVLPWDLGRSLELWEHFRLVPLCCCCFCGRMAQLLAGNQQHWAGLHRSTCSSMDRISGHYIREFPGLCWELEKLWGREGWAWLRKCLNQAHLSGSLRHSAPVHFPQTLLQMSENLAHKDSEININCFLLDRNHALTQASSRCCAQPSDRRVFPSHDTSTSWTKRTEQKKEWAHSSSSAQVWGRKKRRQVSQRGKTCQCFLPFSNRSSSVHNYIHLKYISRWQKVQKPPELPSFRHFQSWQHFWIICCLVSERSQHLKYHKKISLNQISPIKIINASEKNPRLVKTAKAEHFCFIRKFFFPIPISGINHQS